MRINSDNSGENLNTEVNSENVEIDVNELASSPGLFERIGGRYREIGAIATGALALTAAGAYLARHVSEVGGLESTPAAMAAVGDSATGTTTTAETTTTTQTSGNSCEPSNPAVDFGYVSTNVLPLAREVINDYRHTKKSQKTRRKNQSELYDGSYKHLTELDIARPARWENGRKGTYKITAQFRGHVLAKDMVAVDVEEYPSSYEYTLKKTTHDSLEKPWGLHWNMEYRFPPSAKCGVVDSKTANGGQSYYKRSMDQGYFEGTLNQVQGVLKRMEQHKPLASQKNLAK